MVTLPSFTVDFTDCKWKSSNGIYSYHKHPHFKVQSSRAVVEYGGVNWDQVESRQNTVH